MTDADALDAHWLGDRRTTDEDARYDFWADEVADRILERDPAEPIVIKGGISPSGVPHLGNVNEVLRGYFVAESLRERGYSVRQVFTTDDRDPLRKVPRKLADLDGNVVGLGEVDAGALGRNLGKPYTDVPDPFGCCDSYGDHFSNLIAESATLVGVDLEVRSTTDLYESGAFEPLTYRAMAHRERAREVLSAYQDKVDDSYVPFNPICEDCGKITETVTDVRLDPDVDLVAAEDGALAFAEDRAPGDAGTVAYRCTDSEAGEQTIEGCGHEGTATLREGKLPWRFEWPAGWDVLGVDFEPFGKDHAEGSWPSGVDVAENALDVTPPVPMVYEWFTLEGEPFSSSSGHVVLVHDVLDLVEPEVLRYFFTKDPVRARDFSVERLDQLVDEFDRLEARYFGEADGTEAERARAKRVYPQTVRPTVAARFSGDLADAFELGGEEGGAVAGVTFDDGGWLAMADDAAYRDRVDALLDDRFRERARIPYTFAAVLGMFDDPDLRAEVARKQDHLPADAPEWVREVALGRVDLAAEWASRTGNEFDYELRRAEMPDVDFDPATERALAELADFVAEGHDGEAIQGEIYETAKRNDVDVGDFFAAGYRLLFDETEGPQLGPFLAKLDREFVVDRLRRER